MFIWKQVFVRLQMFELSQINKHPSHFIACRIKLLGDMSCNSVNNSRHSEQI